MSYQESKSVLRCLSRDSRSRVDGILDVLAPVEFLVQSNEDEAKNGGHKDGYESCDGTDGHCDH